MSVSKDHTRGMSFPAGQPWQAPAASPSSVVRQSMATSRNLVVYSEPTRSDTINEAVKVAVRLRPINPLEILASKRSRGKSPSMETSEMLRAWTIEKGGEMETLIQKGVGRRNEGKTLFHFDAIFDEKATTQDIYEKIASPIVQSVLLGRNGTIFTYGQTGSGKTFTMQGDPKQSPGVDGIIQMSVRDLFRHIEADSTREYIIRVSFFEIYNEQVRDLLGSGSRGRTSKLSSQTYKGRNSVHKPMRTESCSDIPTQALGGAGKESATSEDGVLELLYEGNRNRSFATTIMNDTSSRSHAIFRLAIESRGIGGESDDLDSPSNFARISALNFVDLAGSENSHRASTIGARLREGGKINQSLLSLSQVIHALSLPLKKRPKFISYRNSKLTRILQPYLEGNALMAVLCCATPSRSCLEETRSSLKFGVNAKRMQMKPVVNEVCDDKIMIKRLQRDLNRAICEINKLKSNQYSTHFDFPQSTPHKNMGKKVCSPETAKSRNSNRKQKTAQNTPEQTRKEAMALSYDFLHSESHTPSDTFRLNSTPLSSSTEETKSGTDERESRAERAEREGEFEGAHREVENTPLEAKQLQQSDDGNSNINDRNQTLSMDEIVCQSTLSDLSSRRPPPVAVFQDSPPSEISIIRSPVSDVGEEADIHFRLRDAQERAKFLEEKLEAADRLVELMSKDLRNARLCIHELVFRNVSLESQLNQLNGNSTVPSTIQASSDASTSNQSLDDGNTSSRMKEGRMLI